MAFEQKLDEVCDCCPKQRDYYGCAKMQESGECPLFEETPEDEQVLLDHLYNG